MQQFQEGVLTLTLIHGKLPQQVLRIHPNFTHVIETQETKTRSNSWLSETIQVGGRSQSPRRAPKKRSQEPDCLTMLPKLNRLSTKEIDLLFKKGGSFRTPLAILRRYATRMPLARFAVIFPKNNKLTSVTRNRIKRQVYAQIEQELEKYETGADYGILLSEKIIAMKSDQRREELSTILKHLMHE